MKEHKHTDILCNLCGLSCALLGDEVTEGCLGLSTLGGTLEGHLLSQSSECSRLGGLLSLGRCLSLLGELGGEHVADVLGALGGSLRSGVVGVGG